MNNMKISEALELFKYNHTDKISIEILYDDGSEDVRLKPTRYSDIKYCNIKDYLKYEVYSIDIEKEKADEPYFKISYCCPHGEWK